MHLLRWRVLVIGWRLLPSLLGLALVTAVLPLLPSLVHLPQLLVSASYLAPRAVLANLLVALLTLATTDEPVDHLGATAAVPLATVRLARMLALTALAVAAPAVTDASHAASSAVAVVTLVGEGLLVARAAEPALAWSVPTAHLLSAATFGVNASGVVAGWAWIIRADVTPGSLIASSVLFLAGLRAWSRHLPADG